MIEIINCKLQNKHDEANELVVKALLKDLSSNKINDNAEEGGSFFVKNDYLNYVKMFIEANEHKSIVSLEVFRRPIHKTIELALKLITLGKFKPSNYGYDYFYHLGLIAHLNDGCQVVIEKNATINIQKIPKKPQGDYKSVSIAFPIMLKSFLKKGEDNMSEYFFYNPFNNNCQVYVLGLLKANHLLTPSLEEFILQPVADLISKSVRGLSSFLTNVASFGNRVLLGGSEYSSKHLRY